MKGRCEEELEELSQEFENFAYIVSHDLKAPVRAISNLAAWIEEDLAGNLPEEAGENFRLLINRSNRLSGMIDALLDYSRVTRTNLETGDLNIQNYIQETGNELQKEKKIELLISGNLPVIHTYYKKLQYVLKEIIKNAIIFNDKAHPVIEVSLSKSTDTVEIEITDNGPGIPDSSLEKIYLIFYTAQPKDQCDTIGAGLAIVKKILYFVNGKINSKNRESGGMVFKLSWPLRITHSDK